MPMTGSIKQNKPFVVLAVTLFALFTSFGLSGTAARAEDAATTAVTTITNEEAVTLSVKSVFMEGDALRIQVTDARTGVDQTLTLDLRAYAANTDAYISVQAVDHAGNRSNTVLFRNPYYVAADEGAVAPDDTPQIAEAGDTAGQPTPGQAVSAVSPAVPPTATTRPFTPDGTGSVVDNVSDGDGKEFFSIATDDGNVFYLIVDRQRAADNVYLLNAVTEDDLASLAKPGNGKGGSGVPAAQGGGNGQSGQTVTATPEPAPESAAPDQPPAKPEKSTRNVGALIVIGIAAAVAGVAAYYFKIVRPKRQAKDDEDAEDYGEDYDDEGDGDDGDGDGDYADPIVYGDGEAEADTHIHGGDAE